VSSLGYALTSQTDARIGSVEVKIKKLDAELGAFKAQMAKLREGPGKVRRDVLFNRSD
jgi:charged multivesicular body protein 5